MGAPLSSRVGTVRIRKRLKTSGRGLSQKGDLMAKKSREWSQSDAALWHTCRMAHELETTGRANGIQVGSLFALAPWERVLAAGELLVEEFRSAGDGSYQRSSLIAGGTGVFGVALLAGTLGGSAIGNARRRSRAAQDAMQAWRFQTQGQITVTDQGFYIQDTGGLWRWDWGSIDLLQMAAPNVVLMQGQSARGPLTWRLSSHWAELVFVLWANARHRQHPQYLSGAWVPSGWVDWASSQGHHVRSFLEGSAPTSSLEP